MNDNMPTASREESDYAVEVTPHPLSIAPAGPSQEELREKLKTATEITVYPQGARYSHKEYRRRIRETFTGGKLSWATDHERMQLEPFLNRSQNRDDTEKRLALAAFFAKGDRNKMAYIYRHLDRALELADDGKKLTVDQAFSEVQKMMQAEQKKLEQEQLERTKAEREANKTFWSKFGDKFTGGIAMLDNLRWGYSSFLFNISTGASHWFRSDKDLEESSAKFAIPRLQQNERVFEQKKGMAFLAAYGVDVDRFTRFPHMPNSSSSSANLLQGPHLHPISDFTTLRPQDILGIVPPPPLLDTGDKVFNSSGSEERWRSFSKDFMDFIKKHPAAFEYAEGADNPHDVWNAYEVKVKTEFARRYGMGAAIAASDRYKKAIGEAEKLRRYGNSQVLASPKARQAEERRDRIESIRRGFEEKFRENQALYHPGDIDRDTLMGYWKRGDIEGVFAKSFCVCYDQVAQSILPLVATVWMTGGTSAAPEITGMASVGKLGLTIAGKGAQLATFSTAMYGEGHQDAIERGLVGNDADAFAFRHMAYEVVPEYLFGWVPILNKISTGRGGAKATFWGSVRAAGKEFIKSGAEDAFGEFLTFTAEKIEDARLGYGTPGNKKLAELSKEEFAKFYADGFPEMLVGSFFTSGPGAAISGFREHKSIMEQRRIEARVEQHVESRIRELQGKESLTDTERRELANLQKVMDSEDLGEVVKAAQKIVISDAIHSAKLEAEGRDTTGAGGDVTEEAAAGANQAAEAEKLKRELPHDPEETRQRVEEAKGSVRAELDTTEEWTKDDLRQRIEQMQQQHPDLTEDQCFEFLQRQIPALWKDGKVIVNVNNCRPSDVPFRIAHEALLHDGIRRAFGDETANRLLDLVWNEQEKSEGMRAILARYGFIRQQTDENGEFVFDDEGNAVWEGYDRLTQDNKREAAEEFLAHLQETNGVPVSEIYQDHKVEIDDFAREHGMDPHDLRKENIDKMTREWMAATSFHPPRPSWLKQLVSRIRTWLRMHGFGVHHLSDDEILTILARSAKAEVSRRGGKSAQAGEGTRYNIGAGNETNGTNETYTLENAVPSKDGYKVERVNENAGTEFNRASGVVCNENAVFSEADLPAEKKMAWIKERSIAYAKEHGIIGPHDTPCLNGKVEVTESGISNDVNHRGTPIRQNMIAVIPEMLKNAVLIQTENNGANKTHILAAKVRYGGERFVVGLVVNENNGKFFYDHELTEINALTDSASDETDAEPNKTSVLNVVRKSLLSSGFDANDAKNTRFSVSPVYTGSAADYVAPSLHYVGTGEGAQVYGYGLYGSGEREVAQWYAQNDAERKNVADVRFDGTSYHETKDRDQFEALRRVYGKDGSVNSAISEYRHMLEMYARPDTEKTPELENTIQHWRTQLDFLIQNRDKITFIPKKQRGIKLDGETVDVFNSPERLDDLFSNIFKTELENDEVMLENLHVALKDAFSTALVRNDFHSAAHHMVEVVKNRAKNDQQSGNSARWWARKIRAAELIAKLSDPEGVNGHKLTWISDPVEGARHLYKQTFWPDKQENLLDWDTLVSRKQLEQIHAQLKKEGLFDKFQPGIDYGEELYHNLVNALGSPKAASEFLYRAGIDGITYIGDTSGVRNYVAFSDKDVHVDEHVRYSVREFDPTAGNERAKNVVAMLRPLVGRKRSGFDNAKLAAQVKERYGVDVTPAEVAVWLNEAIRLNGGEAARNAVKVKKEWLYNNNALWKLAVDYAGSDNFKVRVSERMKDRNLEGTFWLKKGDEKSANTVIDLDALANEVARQQGRDALDVEQEFFDFFNGLTKSGLYEQYNQWQREKSFVDKEQERAAKEEWQQLEKNRIADEVVSIIEHGNPVTPEWAKANLKTYQELYRQLFGGEAPKSVAKRDVETLNAVLTGDISEADFARAKAKAEDAAARAKLADEYRAKAEKIRKDAAERIKANREADYKEFTKKLNELRDAMNQSKLDAEDVAKLQREAEAFAVANLDPAVRGEFTGRILKLKDFSTEPSALYPEGQRMHEFRKLVADMTGRANTARRDALLPRISKLLDRYRVTRQYKGIPVSKAATVQAEIDEIGRIFRMSPAALEAYRGLQLDTMGKFEEESPEWSAARDKVVLSSLFGDLAHRDGNAAQDAMTYLENLVTEGRRETRRKLEERLEKLHLLRYQLIHNLTGGVVDARGADAKKFRDNTIKSRARLESLIQLASGLSVEEFDKSPFGDIVRRYNLAQDREMTKMRKLDGEVREAVARIFGKEYEGFFGFNKFLKELTTPTEHSGVFQTVYTAKVPNYQLVGKRPAIRAKLNWKIAEAALGDAGTGKLTYVRAPDSRAAREHLRSFAEKNGVKFDGDFGIFMDKDGKLRVYTYDTDAGLVNSFEAPLAALPRGCEYMALSEIARNYAQHQIDDCSAGIRPVTSEFAEESADAQYQALNDAQKNAAEVELIADLPNLESSKEELQNLTRDQALQLILTWEQEHYKDTMRWNGFDDATMQQLYDFVGEKHLEFARWMRDYESREADALDKLSREKYGVPLPRIENYHPGRFKGLAGQRIRDGKQAPLGGMSMNPSFLIARRGHLKAPDLNVGAFGVFKDHIQNQTHFVELNDVVGDLRGLFNDLKVKAAINSTLGNNVTDEILRRIGSLATMSSQDRTAATKIFGRLYRHFVPAKLALSLPSMMKQGFSALNYMEKIPMAAWGKYFTRSMSNHADFRKFRKWAWKSDYMQNRFTGGLDPDLVYLANHTLDSEHYDPLLAWVMDRAMIPTKLGDAFASIYGGYTVYAYTRDQALKNGATPLEAEKRARYAWMKATDETQQGSKLTNKNYFMENAGGQRFLTMFMTNPIQTMDLVLQSIDEVRLGRGGTEARKRLARQLVVSHLIIPTAMFAITQAWRRGFDLDEWDWDEWGLDCLLGSFNGFWFVNVAKPVLVKILKIAEGKPAWRSGGERAVPVIDVAESALDTTNRLVKKIGGNKELTAKDYADGVRALGDAMIAGGQADDRVGTAGAIFSALGLRAGQIIRLIRGDEDKRRKR